MHQIFYKPECYKIRVVWSEQNIKSLFLEAEDYYTQNDHDSNNSEKHLAQNLKMSSECHLLTAVGFRGHLSLSSFSLSGIASFAFSSARRWISSSILRFISSSEGSTIPYLKLFTPLPTPFISSGIFFPPKIRRTAALIRIISVAPIIQSIIPESLNRLYNR